MTKKRISFIGAGKVGTALAYLLSNRGYAVTGITSKNIDSAEKAASFMGGKIPYSNDLYVFVEDSDIVFVTTNDDAVPLVAQGVLENCAVSRGQIFAHASGSLKAAVFAPLENKGALGISIHPLQTIANPTEGVKNITGSLFAVEGNEKAHQTARELVESLDGNAFFIDSEKKTLYHLAAVIASNYLVTLMDKSSTIFKNIEIDENIGLQGLLKLVRGTVNNIERLGTKDALTGPIARGDVETIKDHITAIRKFMPELMNFYKVLGEHTATLALEKGSINKEQAKKIKELLAGN